MYRHVHCTDINQRQDHMKERGAAFESGILSKSPIQIAKVSDENGWVGFFEEGYLVFLLVQRHFSIVDDLIHKCY